MNKEDIYSMFAEMNKQIRDSKDNKRIWDTLSETQKLFVKKVQPRIYKQLSK